MEEHTTLSASNPDGPHWAHTKEVQTATVSEHERKVRQPNALSEIPADLPREERVILIDAARKAAAARNAAEAVKMGYAVGRNGMVHAKLLTLAERTSRGAITSSNIFKGTAAGSIA